MNYKEIILGGGCFWCIEAVFERIKGVMDTEVGYSGGADNPTYESVCNGDNNIEVVKIIYDKNQISLKQILTIFFDIHDPTSKDKQGADEGIQYRSAIFYQNDEDFKIITQFLQNAQKNYTKVIVTQILKLEKYHKGEDYHQKYFTKNPNQTYCQFVIAPKIKKINFYK